MTELSEVLNSTQAAGAWVRKLTSEGWDATRSMSHVALTASAIRPTDLIAKLRESPFPLTNAVLSLQAGAFQLGLKFNDEGELFVDESAGDPYRSFNGKDRESGTSAQEGDVEAALTLPGDWKVQAQVDLASGLKASVPTFSWIVTQDLATADRSVWSEPFWKSAPIFEAEQPVIALIEGMTDDDYLVLGRAGFSSFSPDALQAVCSALSEAPPAMTASQANLPLAPRPESLRPIESNGAGFAEQEDHAWQQSAALAWTILGTSARVVADERTIEVEVFGLQRVSHLIPARGLSISIAEAEQSLAMYIWTRGADTLDQQQAVHQVASLYRDQAPWERAGDVLAAARAVFSSLRSDAVAAVMNSRRAARAHAMDIAQRAAEMTSNLTRAAAERLVGILLAIGGVVVAQTTQAITVDQSLALRVLIAGFMLVLVLWSAFIEGPIASDPVKSLQEDAYTIDDLLQSRDVEEILKMDSVVRAKRRATTARWAVPTTYVLAGACALLADSSTLLPA